MALLIARLAGTVTFAAILVVTAPLGPRAQFSPGPLSRAHDGLDRKEGCFDCHGSRSGSREIDARCVDCHGEIGHRLESRSGYHGLQQATQCVSCHPEHGGRSFELIEWPGGVSERFDHALAGWPLEGRHGSAKCRDCHRPERVRGVLRTREGPRDIAQTWLGVDPTCAGCHADPHRGALGSECRDCHGADAWRPVADFDHKKTSFPLGGRHEQTDCARCHPAVDDPDAAASRRWKPIPHTDCTPCHADRHAGAFRSPCRDCHVTTGFRIVSGGRFDHGQTGWSLRGRHASLDCAACHDPVRAWGRKPSRARCNDCHRDVHGETATLRGAPADCAACHDEGGFRPARYTVVDHESAAFPLEGKHREIECARCHRVVDGRVPSVPPDRAGTILRPTFRACRDCHADAHGGQLAGRADDGACESCHTAAGWTPSTYAAAEHRETRLPLDGAHLEIGCRDCHAASRPDLPALSEAVARGSARLALATIDADCASCHRSPHVGQFSAENESASCDRCHSTDRFRPASRFDHDRQTGFQLGGAHLRAPCASCHPVRDVADGVTRALYWPLPSTCRGCHNGGRRRG